MPVNKLDSSFITSLVESRERIVEEYEQVFKTPEYLEHFYLTNWKLLPLYSAEFGTTEEVEFFPSIKKFIEEFPEGLTLCEMAFSVIGYGDTEFHDEQWTRLKGFHRIHIPIKDVDQCSLFIKEDDGITHKYDYEVGNAYEFKNAYNSHKPCNMNENGNTRIFVMFDYIDTNENPDVPDELLFSKASRAKQEFTTPPNLLPPL